MRAPATHTAPAPDAIAPVGRFRICVRWASTGVPRRHDILKRPLCRHGRPNRTGSIRERREHGIALGVHDLTATPGDRCPQDSVMLGQHLRVLARSQPPQRLRRALNVREQERHRDRDIRPGDRGLDLARSRVLGHDPQSLRPSSCACCAGVPGAAADLGLERSRGRLSTPIAGSLCLSLGGVRQIGHIGSE
jgi:hypothetical protein